MMPPAMADSRRTILAFWCTVCTEIQRTLASTSLSERRLASTRKHMYKNQKTGDEDSDRLRNELWRVGPRPISSKSLQQFVNATLIGFFNGER